MRIRLTFETSRGLSLPRHYNRAIHGFICRHLDPEWATEMHDKGRLDPKGNRHLKLFTFSRLQGKWHRQGHKMVFSGPVQLLIASPITGFLESLATRLMCHKTLQLAGQSVILRSIEAEPTLVLQRPMVVKALSPITVYSTVETPQGKRKTYYYSPWEQDFERLLLQNLERKARVWYGREVPIEGYIQPFKVSPRDEQIVKFKDTVIKGWTGVYELDLAPELREMAYHAGLGAKNSQGFGCIGLWEPGKDLKLTSEGVEHDRRSAHHRRSCLKEAASRGLPC